PLSRAPHACRMRLIAHKAMQRFPTGSSRSGWSPRPRAGNASVKGRLITLLLRECQLAIREQSNFLKSPPRVNNYLSQLKKYQLALAKLQQCLKSRDPRPCANRVASRCD